MNRDQVTASAADSVARRVLLQVAIVLLVLATAAIHLYLSFVLVPRNMGTPGPDIMFMLNGLGYLGLGAALYLPLAFLRPWRSRIRWALIGYTALTIVLWFVMAFLPGDRSTLGYTTKAIELLLIVLLVIESRQPDR